MCFAASKKNADLYSPRITGGEMKGKALTKDGQPCRAPVTSTDGYCFFHADPGRASRLGRFGGQKNRRPQIQIEIPEKIDAGALQHLTVQGLRAIVAREMNHGEAAAYFAGCNSLQRLLPYTATPDAIAELERRFEEYKRQAITDPNSKAADSELRREGENINMDKTDITPQNQTENISATRRTNPKGRAPDCATGAQDTDRA